MVNRLSAPDRMFYTICLGRTGRKRILSNCQICSMCMRITVTESDSSSRSGKFPKMWPIHTDTSDWKCVLSVSFGLGCSEALRPIHWASAFSNFFDCIKWWCVVAGVLIVHHTIFRFSSSLVISTRAHNTYLGMVVQDLWILCYAYPCIE